MKTKNTDVGSKQSSNSGEDAVVVQQSDSSVKARFDGYVASEREWAINEVFWLFGHRAVVRERFEDFEKWQAERLDRNRPPKEDRPGFVTPGTRYVSRPAEPPRGVYYYGVDWLPEERAAKARGETR